MYVLFSITIENFVIDTINRNIFQDDYYPSGYFPRIGTIWRSVLRRPIFKYGPADSLGHPHSQGHPVVAYLILSSGHHASGSAPQAPDQRWRRPRVRLALDNIRRRALSTSASFRNPMISRASGPRVSGAQG